MSRDEIVLNLVWRRTTPNFKTTPCGARRALLENGREEDAAKIKTVLASIAPSASLPTALASLEEVVDDQTAQKATVSDLRDIGTALTSWLTDEASAAAAGTTMALAQEFLWRARR